MVTGEKSPFFQFSYRRNARPVIGIGCDKVEIAAARIISQGKKVKGLMKCGERKVEMKME